MRPTQFNLGEFGGGVFAEFETNLRRERRQLEGIAKAKAAGVYKGRPPSIDSARVREMKAQSHGPAAIAKRLKIGRASVYRVLSMAQVPNTNKGLLPTTLIYISLASHPDLAARLRNAPPGIARIAFS
jgi:hypothetical protein